MTPRFRITRTKKRIHKRRVSTRNALQRKKSSNTRRSACKTPLFSKHCAVHKKTRCRTKRRGGSDKLLKTGNHTDEMIPKDIWSKSNDCYLCKSRALIKHHCRACGKTICSDHSIRVRGQEKCHTVCSECKETQKYIECEQEHETLLSRVRKAVRSLTNLPVKPIRFGCMVFDNNNPMQAGIPVQGKTVGRLPHDSTIVKPTRDIYFKDVDFHDTPLGKGNFGTVFRVKGDQDLAYKRIELNQSNITSEFLKEIQKEVRLLRMIDHKNVLSCKGYVSTPDFITKANESTDVSELAAKILELFPSGISGWFTSRPLVTVGIVTQLCELGDMGSIIYSDSKESKCGKSIRQKWESNPLSIMFQIVDGVRYLHNIGIIHRDLKPDNIFMQEDGTPIVGDLGWARLATNLDTKEAKTVQTPRKVTFTNIRAANATANIGTAAYVAPEVIKLDSNDLHQDYTERVDVYSLGITFNALLEERVPYKAYYERQDGFTTDQLFIAVKIKHFRPTQNYMPAVVEYDEQLTSIVKKCWQQDPQERYTMQQLYDELETLIRQTEQSTDQAPVHEDGGTPQSRTRAATVEIEQSALPQFNTRQL